MVERGGIELILGTSIDPQFGPVLLFGAGGELVEVMQDRALAFPPLTETLARRLMEQTRIFHAFSGVRGRKAVDLNALAQILVSFSHLVSEQRSIAEIDINPLLAEPGRFLALDARVVLHIPTLPDAEFPRLAIRPYPAEYVNRIRLKNGTLVTLRPIRPEDEDMLVAFHSTLSEASIHFRYFSQLPLKTRIAHERLVRICFADYDCEIPLVAECEHDDTCELIGVGRLNRFHDRNEAEWAIIVSDAWQNQGLGRQLLEALIRVGRAEKLDRITGTILAGNGAMLHVSRALGFHVQRDANGEEFKADLKL